jgi:hypothetical protein
VLSEALARTNAAASGQPSSEVPPAP